ncbi:MAG: succinate dehydrogenase, cytochrome b subunit [Candidatus Midichloriaceae bacterium]|jgi:succinate dehydrogenase / fumarate reductase membrane anchor subunit|nr:succinate dehydrogenase, cytochrome b subunit [Candidatus Midichloriaceae bacterium]
MDMRTPLAKVKNLGAAKSGTDDFIKQTVTAIFMVPLLIWFVVVIILFIKKDIAELPWFITSPYIIIGAILFILNAFYHAALGLKMVITDYIQYHALRSAALLLMYATIITTVVAGLVAVFSVYILLRIG